MNKNNKTHSINSRSLAKKEFSNKMQLKNYNYI